MFNDKHNSVWNKIIIWNNVALGSRSPPNVDSYNMNVDGCWPMHYKPLQGLCGFQYIGDYQGRNR